MTKGVNRTDLGWINRALGELRRDLRELRSRKEPRFSRAQYDSPDFDLPSSWTYLPMADQVFVQPAGYTRAQLLVYVTAGSSFTGSGNGLVGVQPYVSYGYGVDGPAISNGISGGGSVSAVSVLSAELSGLDPAGGTVYAGLSAYATGSASVVASSGNVHLSVQVQFLR